MNTSEAVQPIEIDEAEFIQPPRLIIPHRKDRRFIGQRVIRLSDGSLMMMTTSGRPPADFSSTGIDPTRRPEIYMSDDNGHSWRFDGQMNIEWNMPGMMSDGGVSLLYLHDGRLASVIHRNAFELHGGGVPVFSTSSDDGKTWRPAKMLANKDNVYYVMNGRLRQLGNGRLVLPVAHLPSGKAAEDYEEGDTCEASCFYSDDAGESWILSPSERCATSHGDIRGMAEPAVEIIDGDNLIMLARTGAGCLCVSYSEDGGLQWSMPEKTTLISPCSSFALQRTPDDKLVVVYNHAQPLEPGGFFPRNPLAFSISENFGKSWSRPYCIDMYGLEFDDRDYRYVYPDVCFTEEGMLIVYSSHISETKNGFTQSEIPLEDEGIKSAIIRY